MGEDSEGRDFKELFLAVLTCWPFLDGIWTQFHLPQDMQSCTMHGLLLWLDGKRQHNQFLKCNSLYMRMCAGAIRSAGGSGGAGWLGSLRQLLRGPCCHKGFGGSAEAFRGMRGRRPCRRRVLRQTHMCMSI